MSTKSTKKIPSKRRKKKGNILAKLLILVLICSLIIFIAKQFNDKQYPLKYQDIVIEYAEENSIDPLLVMAIIKNESSFDHEATSHAGAVGLMQIMPNTAEWLCGKYGLEYTESNLKEPEFNIQLGCIYLRFLMDYWDGSLPKVLASYNAGQSNVTSWLDAGKWDGSRENAGDIPFNETAKYVEKVMASYKYYKDMYN